MTDFRAKTFKSVKSFLHGAVTILSSASIVVSSVASSYAQTIIVNPSAPGTSFLQSSNGTPQIDIATPQSGVSVNQYTDFNVGSDGLILNNSDTGGVSIIGQNVTANPNLMVSGPADVIVNEVTSQAPSDLTGTTEVFGQRAAVIIANPNGITCNGCSFLNSSSSTLTTGTPVVENGEVDLLVSQGTITIGPDGFNPGQQGGIFGRHVTLNGPVATDGQTVNDRLSIVGGAHRADLNLTQIDNTLVATAPSLITRASPFAIDASEAGTVTGGHVHIQSKESGQGVNLYGDLNARYLRVRAWGDLFYKNADAVWFAQFIGRDVRQYGDVSVQTQRPDETLTSVRIRGNQFTLYNGRKIDTVGNVELTGSDFVVIAGEVSGRNINVTVSDGSLTNNGFLMASGDLTILADDGVSQKRDIATEYDTNFNPVLLQYLQTYYDQLLTGGDEADIAAEMIARAQEHEVLAEYIDRGATATGTNVTITATNGDITNTGGAIASTGDMLLEAGADIINTYLALRTTLTAEDGCTAENCGYRTDFHAGEILSGGDLSLNAAQDIRNEASDIAAAGHVSLIAGQDIINSLARSDFVATEVVQVETAGAVQSRYCTGGKDSYCSTRVVQGVFTDNQQHQNEEVILSPGRIVSLYGAINAEAGRDLNTIGSVMSAGKELNISAENTITLTGITASEEDYIRRTEQTSVRRCGGKENNCTTNINVATITDTETSLVSTLSQLSGQEINLTSGKDLTLSGARLFASGDLDLKSTEGSVLIDTADLPGMPSGEELPGDRFANLQDRTITNDLTAYPGFLNSNDLLTSVEALHRADSGADIKDNARSVGAQSYVSLIDSTYLQTLKMQTRDAIDQVHTALGSEIRTQNEAAAEYYADIRAQLAQLSETFEPGNDATVQLEIEAAEQRHLQDVSEIETTYQAALAASQAQFGHLLTKRVRESYQYRGGKENNLRTGYRWVTRPDPHYIALKDAADALAASERQDALQASETKHLLEVAFAEAAFADPDAAVQIEQLSNQFFTDTSDFGTQKAQTLETLNTSISDAMHVAALVVQQEVIEADLRNELVAANSVVEGQRSLAASLTNETFPELSLIQDLAVNSGGIIENSRDGDQEQVRLVTRTRDIGELQDRPTTERQRQSYQQCGLGKEGDQCRTRYRYVDVEVLRPQWVVTGTEEYLAEETYFDGVASTTALISEDLAEQDAFLDATAWRFATADIANTNSSRNHLLTQGDLRISGAENALIGNGTFEAQGNVNLTSFGAMLAKQAEISGNQLNITTGGNLDALGVRLISANDLNIFSAGAVNLSPFAHSYTISDVNDPIVGELASDDWTRLTGQTVVSQELSEVDVDGDLSVYALGDLYLNGVQAEITGDVELTSGANIQLAAPGSVIEYHVGSSERGTDSVDVRAHATRISSGGNFSATAGDTLLIEGTEITSGGNLDLAALNNVTVSAATNAYRYYHRTKNSRIFGTTRKYYSTERVIHDGADLTATGDISIESQAGDLITAGGRFESLEGNVNLSATAGNVLAGVFEDIDRNEYRKRSSSFGGLISSSVDDLSEFTSQYGTAALAEQDLTIVSGEDTELIGAQLSAGGDLNLNIGGDLRILAAINTAREEFFESKLGAITATTTTERSLQDTAITTTLNADGSVNFEVGGNAYLSLYSTEDEDGPNAAELYPEELLALTNLILLDEELRNEYFFEETKALSPAFMAVMSIVLTSGFGGMIQNAKIAGLVDAAGNLTNAGKAVASFASSSTLGIANGAVSGDLDLGDILASAAISAGTQFLTSAIDLKASGDIDASKLAEETAANLHEAATSLKSISILGGQWSDGLSASLFGTGNLSVANVLEGAFDASVSAGVNSAVYGTSFKDSFGTSMIQSVVALGLADVQNEIGNVFADGQNGGEGSLGHVLLHGIAGCAAAEAQGADCGAGAAGAAVQALYAGGPNTQEPDPASFENPDDYLVAHQQWADQNLKVIKFIGTLTGFVFSGGEGENVTVTASIAESGYQNNYLGHTELVNFKNELAECTASDADCLNTVAQKYVEISEALDADFAACSTDSCRQYHLSRIEAAEISGAFDSILNNALLGQLNGFLAKDNFAEVLRTLQYTRADSLDLNLFEGLGELGIAQLRTEVSTQMCSGDSIAACDFSVRAELYEWGALNDWERATFVEDVGLRQLQAHAEVIGKMRADMCGGVSDSACDTIIETEIERQEAQAARVGGALMIVGGSLEIVAGVTAAPTCETGVGCVLAYSLLAHGSDTAGAGFVALWTGVKPETLGGRLLQEVGLTPDQAELIYGFAGAGLEIGALRAFMRNPSTLTPSALTNYKTTGTLPDFPATNWAPNLNVRGLDDVPGGLANPVSIRSDVSQHVKAGNRDSFSVATASVEVNGQTQRFISVSGNSWKGNAPDTVILNGQTYTVVRTDSGSVPAAPNGTQTNFNHAEQKLFSHIQDNYAGQNVNVNVAVQNTSAGSPGMCTGCSATSGTFASGNTSFNINIFQGSSGVNP